MVTSALVATARGLSYEYRAASQSVRALDGVDLDIAGGRLTALVGPTGSGKSTLLRLLAGVERPSAGTLVVAGRDLAGGARARRLHRRLAVGAVAQEPAENVLDHLDAMGHLELVAVARGCTGGEEERAAALAEVGLAGRADVPAGRLSGGEQQRLAVAMATFGPPALVVADEPTAELDRVSADAVADALLRLCRRGGTVVACSHDRRLVSVAESVIPLRAGRVVHAR